MNELRITTDTQLEPRPYILPGGITIDLDNITLDGNGATIMGVDKTNSQGINFWAKKRHHQKHSCTELLPWGFGQKT